MKKKASRERLDLVKQMKEIDLQHAQVKNPILYKEQLELQVKFDLLSTHSVKHQLLKCKSRFYIHGDKAGKILANQLRETKVTRHITEIKMEDSNMTTDLTKMNDSFSKFYNKLCTSEFLNDSTHVHQFLNNLNIPGLSPDNQRDLEKPITKEEIGTAISPLNSGKSPGPDTFPVKFK